MVGIIYKCECILNSKCYIGQTIQSFEKRQYAHKKLAEHNGKQHFYCAIRKHGWENFKWEILETVTGEKEEIYKKLDELEVFYVKKFNTLANGYNQTRGGQYSRFTEFPITVYNIFGEKLGEFSGSIEASKKFGVFRKMIQRACKSKLAIFRSDMKFPIICRYNNEPYTEQEQKEALKRFHHKIVDVYSEGVLIDTLFSQAQCARKYNIDVGSLCSLCNNKESWDVVRFDKHIIFKFRDI